MVAAPNKHFRTLRVLAGAAMTVAALLSGCGTATDGRVPTGTPQPTAVDSRLAAMVPAAIRSTGRVVIGTDATYAPSEFLDKDGKTVVGFDVELFDAVAAKLGLKTQWVPSKFDEIIPGVQKGTYNVGVSSFSITNERLQQANMISYFRAGTQWAAKSGASTNADNACGKSVAVQIGTVQISDLQARSKRCTDTGKKPIRVHQYEKQSDATAAVLSGKDDAMLADSPVCAYAVKQQNGKLQTVGNIYDSAPYGYVIPKGQEQFAQAIESAMDRLIVNGVYRTIASKWGLGAGMITDSSVNPVL
jgi:polar amino acid transport system substrate-binding protein